MNGNNAFTADRTPPAPEQRSGRLTVAALRRAAPTRTWGGKGCGTACDFCRVIVPFTDIEYEVEALLDGEVVTLHFHTRCHEAWQTECESPQLSIPA